VVAGLIGRKADAFAALLDGTGKAGTQDPALAHLAQLTQRLSAVPQPSAAFKSALREQLVHAAAHPATAPAVAGALHTVPRPRVSPGHGAGSGTGGIAGGGAGSSSSAIMTLGKSAPLWIKLFTGVTAAAVSATGVGVGAHRALPGDPFYGIKKQVEAVQLDLASGARDKATTQLGFAHARINELKQLIKRDHVTPTSKLSSATEAHIRGLLQAWAEDAGVATTSLIQQIRGLGSNASTAALSAELRKTLASFTSASFGQIGALLADVPAGPLQSLTVSALGYLQRVDGVLGGNPATLIQQLPIPLSAIPNLTNVLPQLNLPAGLASGGKVPSITSIVPSAGAKLLPTPLTSALASPLAKLPKAIASLSIPTKIPTVTLPTSGAGGITLPTAGVGSLVNTLGGAVGTGADGGLAGTISEVTGSVGKTGTGGVGKTVTGVTGSVGATVNGVGGTVDNTVKGVTGSVGSTVNGVTGSVGKTVTGSGGTNAVSGVTGSVGSTVAGTVSGVTGTVSGTVGTVTGGLTSSSGPVLPLPTALPTLPPLPKLPTLPGLGG
jgi:hypothetical protein